MKISVLLIASLLLLAVGCASSTNQAIGKSDVATTQPMPTVINGQMRVPINLPVSEEAKSLYLDVMGHECMARFMFFRWVQSQEGFTVSYIDENGVIYLFPEMFWGWQHGSAPWVGVISGRSTWNDSELVGRNVVPMRPPIRFRETTGDKVEVGFFEPSLHLFFRWRGILMPTQSIEGYYFNPEDHPISPLISAKRINTTVDIDPDEGRVREISISR